MSNICARISDHGVGLVSDSLSYAKGDAAGKKSERTQKLFHVAGSIAAGIGDSECITDTINKLQQDFTRATPKELAERAVEITQGFNLNPDERYCLYFTGTEKGFMSWSPELYVVSTKTAVARKIIPGAEGYVLGGRGEEYMKEAIKRDRNRGFEPSQSARLSEIADFLYDASMVAPQSLYVNRELQFAFSGKKGPKILYDPDVDITNAPPEYANGNGAISEDKKWINDAAYKILMVHLALRSMLKMKHNEANQLEWNRINPDVTAEKARKVFESMDAMTDRFLNEYLKCDYKNYRAWIEDENQDLLKFADRELRQVLPGENKGKEVPALKEAAAYLPETKAKGRYTGAFG